MGLDSAATKVSQFSNDIRNPAKRAVKNTLNGDDFIEGFRFEELGGNKDKVILAGSYMPKEKFTFGGEQKITKEFYPGNSEPSLHILGSQEEDVIITGRFYDKRYPVGQDFDGMATKMQQLIDDIRRGGQILKITLGEWKRYGILTKCSFDMKRLGDIEYSITFSILGLSLPKNYRFLDESQTMPYAINRDLIAKAALYQIGYTSIPETMPASIGDMFKELINDLASAIKLVTDTVDAILSVVEDIASAVNRLLGLVRYAMNVIQAIKTRLGKLTFAIGQSLTYGTRAAGTLPNPIMATQQAAAFISGAISGANTLAAMLAEMRERFRAMARTVPDRRHRVIDGDTLQRLAVKFYGNADEWRHIYDHNKLTTTDLTVGAILEIPKA
jgi:hypothetical protein